MCSSDLEQAVAIALLWFLTTIISGLLGGLLFLLDRRAITPGPFAQAADAAR